jgi:hypothetical protein
MFFIDDDAPIFMHTDASDYGIGVYLFQSVEGIEKPIQFMSKSLSTQEQHWSTIEKELYAIVYALRKFEYLLRDRHFILRTDHENLKYLNDPPSPKVRRWKLTIQEYDFDLEHIKGVQNVAADAFSRLSPIGEKEELLVIADAEIPPEKYKIIALFHNSDIGHFGVDKTLSKTTKTRMDRNA